MVKQGEDAPSNKSQRLWREEDVMKNKRFIKLLWGGAAFIALIPGVLHAQTAKEKELEARIMALENVVGTMQGELEKTRTENAQLRATVAPVATKPAEMVSAAKPVETAPDGFTVGNGNTRVKIGGFIKTVATFSKWDDGDAAANSLGRDFYLPQTIPVGGTRESTDFDFSAKQTRLWLNLETKVAGRTLKGYVETDFQTATGTQGSERTTNGYNLALRRAFVQFDKLTVGQDWSTFQYVGALPESTDFVGPTEGTVFVRQPLVRYSQPLGKGLTLHVSAENPETASANLGSPALIENDDDSLPDFAARLNYAGKYGELSFAGLVRQLAVDNGPVNDEAMGFGASLGGKVFLDKNKRYDVRFMATYGNGLGRYIGINFAPDAVFVAGPNTLRKVKNFAAFSALRMGWTPKLRSTFAASVQEADYSNALPTAAIANYNDKAWSFSSNLFWSPVSGLDLGVEYRHGERTLVSGASGQLNRVEFAARYNF
jgi:DcaP outer membrane protein